MVLARYLVEGYAPRGQHGADADLPAESIGRSLLARDVLAETGPIVYAQDSLDRSGCGTDGASDNGADRSRGLLTSGRAFLSSTDGALSVCAQWQPCDDGGGNRNECRLHDRFLLVGPPL